jgi:hypothetical protein
MTDKSPFLSDNFTLIINQYRKSSGKRTSYAGGLLFKRCGSLSCFIPGVGVAGGRIPSDSPIASLLKISLSLFWSMSFWKDAETEHAKWQPR